MEFFVGLDVSLDETHLCVVDEGGRIVKEGRCASEPQAIAKAIRHQGRRIEHVGLETGNLSQWLHEGLTREGFSVVVMEARHVRSALSAMRVKTDRNDARGIAQLVRLGWFKRVHVKSLDAQETRALLNARTFLVEKIVASETSLRAALRNFGLKMGKVTRPRWPARARELAAGHEVLETITEAMLRVRALLIEELAALDARLIAMAKADPVTRLLMTVPGVGVIVALSFRSAIDDPDRFKRTRDVGPWLGLTPRRWQSGQTDVVGRITKAGDARVRTMLFEAAAALLGRARRVCALKAWGLRIAQRTSMKKAIVATARKLATVLLAMWRSGTAYWSVPEAAAA
ncbi:MAG: IS110 family transposase [Pseudomonadota bacterium]